MRESMAASYDLTRHLDETIKVIERLPLLNIIALKDLIAETIRADGTLFTAGNGGGSTVAEHLALGMSLNVLREAGTGMRSVCLSSSGAFVSAAVNDFGPERMFSVQLEALARPNDAFVAISASGCSANLAHAIATAKKLGMRTAAIVGLPGLVSVDADVQVVLDTPSAAISEDVGIVLLHWVYGAFMVNMEAKCTL